MKRREFLLSSIVLAGCGAAPEDPVAEAPAEEPSFIPADFEPPTEVVGDGFVLVPLDTNVTEMDYKAYMSSIEHLQTTFTHSTSWPREGLTMEDAVKDMQNEQAQWEGRISFPYAVLEAERTRERGCVYVRPSKKEGYEAVVRMWVTAEEFKQGFDEELYAGLARGCRRHGPSNRWPIRDARFPWKSGMPSRTQAARTNFLPGSISFCRARILAN